MSDYLNSTRDRVHDVGASAGEPEGAHGMEDDLYLWLLQSIASGDLRGEDARQAAAMAVETQKFAFPRWCA